MYSQQGRACKRFQSSGALQLKNTAQRENRQAIKNTVGRDGLHSPPTWQHFLLKTKIDPGGVQSSRKLLRVCVPGNQEPLSYTRSPEQVVTCPPNSQAGR